MAETLPRELSIEILLMADFDSILALEKTNTRLQEIVKEENFWPNKLLYSYPLYCGNLYQQSAKSTIRTLDQGRQIVLEFAENFQREKTIMMKILPSTTLSDISFELAYSIPNLSIGLFMISVNNHTLYSRQYSDQIPTKFYYDQFNNNEPVALNVFQPLYSIALPVDNQNLYINIKKVMWTRFTVVVPPIRDFDSSFD